MALNFDYIVEYESVPAIQVGVINPESGVSILIECLVDTAADITLLDPELATLLGLDYREAPQSALPGLSGDPIDAEMADADLELLGDPALRIPISVTFAPNSIGDYGSLLGLDVLSFLDLGLAHREQTLYLGMSDRR